MKQEKQNQLALITGATSGIGLELAKIFASEGYDLVLVARTNSDLHTVGQQLQDDHGVEVHSIAKDLFDINAANEVYEEVKAMA